MDSLRYGRTATATGRRNQRGRRAGEERQLHTALEEESKAPSRVSKPDLLRRFLQVYWLRPENAFWMTLRSETLADCPIEQPALDIACGDGLFSFLHCGGGLRDSTQFVQKPGDVVDPIGRVAIDGLGDAPLQRTSEPIR